jgi:hypothetical protein
MCVQQRCIPDMAWTVCNPDAGCPLLALANSASHAIREFGDQTLDHRIVHTQ